MVKTGTGKLVDRNSGCSYGSRSMGILAVTGEKIADQSSWVAWAKSNQGYMTPSEQKKMLQLEARIVERIVEEEKRKQLNQLNQYNLNKSLVINSRIGTKICKEHGIYVYTGFKEGGSNERIKVLVADAKVKGARGMRPGGFTQSYIWDDAGNWRVCE